MGGCNCRSGSVREFRVPSRRPVRESGGAYSHCDLDKARQPGVLLVGKIQTSGDVLSVFLNLELAISDN